MRLEPRGAPPLLLVVAPRADAVPWTRAELRAVLDVGRLAALALGDAVDAARLEAEIEARTGVLRRALADRTALLGAAECIQAAPDAVAVRACVRAFLAARSERPVTGDGNAAGGPDRVTAELCRPPAGRERLVVSGLAPERAADLQPQAEAVCALANLALERLHLLDGLKLEVARQASELARSDTGRRRAEFVRRIAHELRKPGEEIQHLVTALRLRAPKEALGGLERIESAALELTRRLDTLLSRQDARLDVRRVDLARLVEEASRRVAALRARRFELHRGGALPLLGDPVRLGSLIENLLDNAARATREGGHVAIRCARIAPRDERGPWILLEVEDDGIGVSPDLGESIFEPGVGEFRGGFGLGLALCRDIVALHGGRIEVESQPGRSVFRVRLPQLGREDEES
jgi:signal transduction histidine kinase